MGKSAGVLFTSPQPAQDHGAGVNSPFFVYQRLFLAKGLAIRLGKAILAGALWVSSQSFSQTDNALSIAL
ncbi:MAG: hypothetical protein ACREOI_00140 [bacterium]